VDDDDSNPHESDSESSTDDYLSDEETSNAASHHRSSVNRVWNHRNSSRRRSLFGLPCADPALHNQSLLSATSHVTAGVTPAQTSFRPSTDWRSTRTDLPLTQTSVSGSVHTRADEFHLPRVTEGASYGESTPVADRYATPTRTPLRGSSRGTRSLQR
jgi:hypothetical protein